MLDAERLAVFLCHDSTQYIVTILYSIVLIGSVHPKVALIVFLLQCRLCHKDAPFTICSILRAIGCFERCEHIRICDFLPCIANGSFRKSIGTSTPCFCERAIVIDVIHMLIPCKIILPFHCGCIAERRLFVSKPKHHLLIALLFNSIDLRFQ